MIVGVKVFSPANKKEFKMYTLRNVHATDFNDPTTLKMEVFSQLGDEVVRGTLDFDIRYLVRNGYTMLKMLVMHWGQPKMEANLLYGVLALVQRVRPQDRSNHMQILELAMRSPQRKK